MNLRWRRIAIRFGYGLTTILAAAACVAIVLLLESKQFVYQQTTTRASSSEPFPVSVNVQTKKIQEDPAFNTFYTTTLAQYIERDDSWYGKIAATFMSKAWYQNLASPVSRIIVIWPGERKEQIAKNIGDVLRWNEDNRAVFTVLMDDLPPNLGEGTFLPGQYMAHRYATPVEIADLIQTNYKTEVLDRYPPAVSAQVPLADALIIASLIEREASDFANMREVSGVIWNRIFIDMPLQLDASLQYVRGSNLYEPAWWPTVKPQDKYLDSAHNTYQNAGLPPTPIANPSIEAIVAALNPIETDCLFYFHTEDGGYVCTDTYEDHVSELKKRYGRGS